MRRKNILCVKDSLICAAFFLTVISIFCSVVAVAVLFWNKIGSSCMTVGGFPLHKFAWPLFYGLLSRSSGPRNFD